MGAQSQNRDTPTNLLCVQELHRSPAMKLLPRQQQQLLDQSRGKMSVQENHEKLPLNTEQRRITRDSSLTQTEISATQHQCIWSEDASMSITNNQVYRSTTKLDEKYHLISGGLLNR